MLKSRRRQVACIQTLLSLALLAPLAAQRIRYTPVLPSVLEERLKRVTRENKLREEVLRKLFEEAGCEQLSEQALKGLSTPNVVCRLPGEGKLAIVVGAHYDKVADGDGVIDNWGGASLLPSLFESLKESPRRLTFLFVGFSDEEDFLRGSRAYVKALNREEKGSITAMVDIDCLGLGPTKIEVNLSNKQLVDAAWIMARALKLQIAGVNMGRVGMSDAASFRDIKVPTLDFHSVTQETLPILNGRRDTAAALRMEDYIDTYRLIGAYLAYLDETWGKQVAPPVDQRVPTRSD
jgi:hypothetical protein